MNKHRQNQLVFSIFIIVFIFYCLLVYTGGTESNKNSLVETKENNESFSIEQAALGKEIWQKNNCTACHQLYGLGGFLGPDLTNVYDRHKEGLVIFLDLGRGTMPVYDFSEEEKASLVAYFYYVNKSGEFPNKNIEKTWYGDVKIKNYNNE